MDAAGNGVACKRALRDRREKHLARQILAQFQHKLLIGLTHAV